MAQAIKSEQLTLADELRQLLTASETQIPNLAHSSAQALEFLHHLDRIAELWPQTEALGVDLRPEAGRWDTVQAQAHQNASTIIKQLRADGGLAAARNRAHPDGAMAWWWRLDEEVQTRRLHRARNTLLSLLSVAAFLVAALFLFNKAFPVDPAFQASFSKRMDGQRAIEEGNDYPTALQAFAEASALKPDDAEPWLWLGVTQQKLGDTAAAQASFTRAHQILEKDFELYAQRAPVYLAFRMLDEAGADLERAAAIDPEEPRVPLYQASLYEMQGRLELAIKALERSSELSDQRNQPELTAIARYRLAMLMQMAQTLSFQNPTTTPTPR